MIELDYTVDIVFEAATFFLDWVKSPFVSILSDSFVSSSLMQVELAFFLMNILFDIFLSSARSVHSE